MLLTLIYVNDIFKDVLFIIVRNFKFLVTVF